MSAYLKNPNLTAAAIVVACSLAAPSAHAALTRLLEVPSGSHSALSAISSDGTTLMVSGWFETGGWIWRDSTGFVQLPDATFPEIGGISHDGSFVTGSLPTVGAFRYDTVSKEFEFPPINSPETRALALSQDGSTVLLATPEGVYLWKGDLQFRISTQTAPQGSVSADGHAAVFVAPNQFGTYLWTEVGGLQQLSAHGYVRNALISADGSRVVFAEYESRLRIWKIDASGIASEAETDSVRSAWVNGSSPDCSIVGLTGRLWSPTAWTEQTSFTYVENLLWLRGATVPFGGSFTTLIGTSADNRILTGTVGVPTSEGFLDPHIWLVDLDRHCPAELTFDAQVDDADFVVFSAGYDASICPDPEWGEPCPADFNHDGFVDDTDFAIFAGAYDQLLCN